MEEEQDELVLSNDNFGKFDNNINKKKKKNKQKIKKKKYKPELLLEDNYVKILRHIQHIEPESKSLSSNNLPFTFYNEYEKNNNSNYMTVIIITVTFFCKKISIEELRLVNSYIEEQIYKANNRTSEYASIYIDARSFIKAGPKIIQEEIDFVKRVNNKYRELDRKAIVTGKLSKSVLTTVFTTVFKDEKFFPKVFSDPKLAWDYVSFK